ncbi:rCG55595 [Rattus norvegicus]|uniref:RCG55595 n=1 Tax=Rattus norvegicus TaxID=10116 RepID=A6JQJ9_RAT|nr:rCG55595 [Rattus norvegicus]
MLELRVGWVGGLVGSGREGPVVCPLAPGGKLGCQRDKSDFFLLQQGQKFRLPSPHCGGESRVSYLRFLGSFSKPLWSQGVECKVVPRFWWDPVVPEPPLVWCGLC